MPAKEYPSLTPGQPISMPTQAMRGFAPCRLHHLKTHATETEVMTAVSADEDAPEAEVSEAEASILEIVREEAEASLAAKFSKSKSPYPYKDYSTTIVRRHAYARLTVGGLDTVCRCYTSRSKQP